jgi:hypothetical protein
MATSASPYEWYLQYSSVFCQHVFTYSQQVTVDSPAALRLWERFTTRLLLWSGAYYVLATVDYALVTTVFRKSSVGKQETVSGLLIIGSGT